MGISAQNFNTALKKKCDRTAKHAVATLTLWIDRYLRNFLKKDQVLVREIDISICTIMPDSFALPNNVFDWPNLMETTDNEAELIRHIESLIKAKYPNWEYVYFLANQQDRPLIEKTIRLIPGFKFQEIPTPADIDVAFDAEVERMIQHFVQAISKEIAKILGIRTSERVLVKDVHFSSNLAISSNATAEMIYNMISITMKERGWAMQETQSKNRIFPNERYNLVLTPLTTQKKE
jgi:hypothetical protein